MSDDSTIIVSYASIPRCEANEPLCPSNTPFRVMAEDVDGECRFIPIEVLGDNITHEQINALVTSSLTPEILENLSYAFVPVLKRMLEDGYKNPFRVWFL